MPNNDDVKFTLVGVWSIAICCRCRHHHHQYRCWRCWRCMGRFFDSPLCSIEAIVSMSVCECEIAISKCISSPALTTAIDQYWPRLFKPITISLSTIVTSNSIWFCLYLYAQLPRFAQQFFRKMLVNARRALFSLFITFMVNFEEDKGRSHNVFVCWCVKWLFVAFRYNAQTNELMSIEKWLVHCISGWT